MKEPGISPPLGPDDRDSHRPGTHVRVGHRQDRLDRPDPEDAALLDRRVRHRLPADDGPALLHRDALRPGHRHLGRQRARRLGIRDRQLRLVDRDRPRRDADLGDPAAAAAGVAHLDQPVRRGDDALRRGPGGDVPDPPPGPPVARLLARPLPQHDGALAAVAKPARLGRLRGLDLRDGVAALLVRRPDPGPRDAARPLAARSSRRSRTGCWRWAGAARRCTGTATTRRTCCSPASRRRWSSRCTPSSPSTSRSGSSRAGTRRSFRPTSSPARSTAASRWS